jgi:ATP-dependent 26S proteasome regulatory subunit
MEMNRRIRTTKLLEYQNDVAKKIVKIADYVFKNEVGLKFSGFLLSGPPGNGKTEIAKQAAVSISKGIPVKIFLLDGSDIASPKWGEAEDKLKKAFTGNADNNSAEKRIIIFDDIESTLMSRDADISKEWHFSINSVVFHLLDDIDHSNTLVIATTNKPEMVDPALVSRLYPIAIPALTKDQLAQFALFSLENGSFDIDRERVFRSLSIKINQGKIKSLRDVEHEILLEVVEMIGD